MLTIETFTKKLAESTDWLTKEFTAIRTGQAAPALIDRVKVESYGSLMPLQQVASIGIEDARTLRVSPWDVSQIAAIEGALTEANLGVSVATDSAGVRVIFPELTSERRAQLTKLAKQKFEDARISVRAARDEMMKQLEQQEKAGDLTKDDLFADKETVQKLVESTNQKLEQLFKAKEADLQK